MRLASLPGDGRDGRLAVVDTKGSKVAFSTQYPTLQRALDDWSEAESHLRQISEDLEEMRIESQALDLAQCLSPLPRAYQWADASAYVNHVELVRRARGAELPPSFWEDPLMYQGGSDSFLAPNEPIALPSEDWGIDFEAEIAVVLDDVPMGVSEEKAGEHIKLLMLVNDVSLRALVPGELAKGFGFYQSKPSSAFAPFAITPDQAGEAWDGEKLALPVLSHLNETLFGCPEAGEDMTFVFPRLIAHAARSRPLSAGTIIGSGTVSNKENGGPGRSIGEGGRGYSCIAELRMIETINQGAPITPFLKFGDRVKIEILDKAGESLFGAIEQEVRQYHG